MQNADCFYGAFLLVIYSQGRHALIIVEGAQVGGEMGVDTAVGLCFTYFFLF